MVEATPEMYGDHTGHHAEHDRKMLPSLRNLCYVIARGYTGGANTTFLRKDPLLKRAGKRDLSSTVFRFSSFGDHRFTGVTDCLYNPHFRRRYLSARAERSGANAGIVRPDNELWLSVHYRAGDIKDKKRGFFKGSNGDLRGLARYVKAAADWVASDPERLHGRGKGLKVVVHLFTEGKSRDFKSFTDVLPGANRLLTPLPPPTRYPSTPHTHMHTRTRAHTHARTRAHVHTCTHPYTRTSTSDAVLASPARR